MGIALWGPGLAYNATMAATLDLPAADRDFWGALVDPLAIQRYLENPDCSIIESNILTVGTVPSRAVDAWAREA